MSKTNEEKDRVAYSPEIFAVRAVLVKHMNVYSAELLADLATLLTQQSTEAYQRGVTAERSRIRPILKNLDVIGYPAISTKEYSEMIDEALTPLSDQEDK